MGLWARIRLLFATKASSAMDRAEDPRQVLDYAYNQQQQLLLKLKQGLVDVATSKTRLELQAKKLTARIPELDEQAKRAIALKRDDLARMALERKRTALAELEGLQVQVAEVTADERRLASQEQQLAARIDEFRTHREVVSARYSAAEAEVRVKEALSGVSGDLAELGMAVGRAEEKTERMQARAKAIDSLVDIGALPSAGGGDYLETQLRQLSAGEEIDQELAKLKAQVSSPRLSATDEKGGKYGS